MVALARERVINTLRYSPELCTGCGRCAEVCPHGVFLAPDHRLKRLALAKGRSNGLVAALVRPEACMECGACQLNCPSEAISVDSGVGCAYALIRAALLGKKEATCDTGCCGGVDSLKPTVRQAEC